MIEYLFVMSMFAVFVSAAFSLLVWFLTTLMGKQ